MPRALYTYARSKSAYHGPDPSVARDQLLKLQYWFKSWGPARFAQEMFWILKKNPEEGTWQGDPSTEFWNKRLIPFRHNNIQIDIDKKIWGRPFSNDEKTELGCDISGVSRRNIYLKPRQGGYTTYMILMRLLLPALLDPGVGCLLISQNAGYAAAHFSMLKRAFRYFAFVDPFNVANPDNGWALNLHRHLLHTSYSNRKELILDQLDSRILCDSAEVEEVGQGLTIQHLACTEIARWEGNPEETLANVKEAVPKDGTVDLESTANMMGGYFYEECMRARENKSEFTYHFHEWWFHEEYVNPQTPVPVEKMTGEEKALIKAHPNLTPAHISWRRMKKLSLRHNFEEKYPEDDISCFLLQGNAYFDTEILGRRLKEIEAEYAMQDPKAKFKKIAIFKKPQAHRRYVIGVDPASGKSASPENLDYAAMVVLDVETGEQMAGYRARIPPEDLAQDAAELGRLYKNALIAIERTGDGGTVHLMLQVANQYTNVYKHREWTKRDRPNRRQGKGGSSGGAGGQRFIELEGFPTSQKTRPIALNRVAIMVREEPELIHWLDFVKECLTFVRDEKGIPAAAEGAHDDSVMAMAIANYCRLVVLGYLDPLAIPSESYDENDQPEVEVAPEEAPVN